MKFRCERDALVEALSVAGRAVSTRNTNLPVLAGLHIEATGDGLVMTGTDLDLGVRIGLPAVVSEEGAVVIPARLATDIVRSLQPGAVNFEVTDSDVRISSGRSQFTVRTLDAEQFPKLSIQDTFTATLPSAELSDALRQVVRAASADDARPVLTGVLLSAEDDKLRFVATDSYRLAIRDIPSAQILQAGQSVLIPSKALGELARLLATAEADVQVALTENEITFLLGDTYLTSRLIDGQFPDYRPLIPKNHPNRLQIDRDVLLDAVRRVKLLVRDITTPVRVALRADGIELNVISQEVGRANEEVEAKYEGEEMTVAFNPAYLIDGLESVPPGDVIIETMDALKPATLRADEHEEFLYLIMPVRVS